MPTDSDFVRLASELVALKNDNYVLRQRVRCLENIVKWCMQYLTFVRTFSTLMFESNMPISAVIFNTDLFDLPYQLVEYTEVCTANVSKYMYETLYSMREFLHHSATIEPDAQMDYDESSEQIITQDDFRPVAEAQQHNPTSSRFFNQTNISQKSPTDRPDSSLEDDRTVNDLLGQDTDYNKLVWVDSAFDDDDLNWSDEPNILTTSSTVAPNTESEDPSETEDTQANGNFLIKKRYLFFHGF